MKGAISKYPKAHFSIWYFVAVFFIIFLLQTYMLAPKEEKIPYTDL